MNINPLDRGPLCPSCGEPLRHWQVGPVAVDGCEQCGGVWFDARELQTLAELPGEPLEALEQAFVPGLGGPGGGDGRCPRCRVALVERRFKQAAVRVDHCPECGGLWLDEGELATLGQLIPKRHGPDLPVADLAAAAAAAGVTAVRDLLRTTHCPRCGERNPAGEPRCWECGADLLAPPPPGPGEIIRSYRLNGWLIFSELVALALVALVLLAPLPARHAVTAEPWAPLGQRLMVLALVTVVALARWPLRTWRIDLTGQGLVVHKLWGARLVPWDSLRGATVIDLGTRAVWYPFLAVMGRSYYGGRLGVGRSEAFDELIEGDRPRGLMLLRTTRGVVRIGPELLDAPDLIARIRERL